MEQIETDKTNICNSTRPILEKYKECMEHSVLIREHLKTIKALSLSSKDIDEKITRPSQKQLAFVQEPHIKILDDLVDNFDKELSLNLGAVHDLKEDHQEHYKTYNDCLRKLDRFSISADEKTSSKNKEMANSQSQRITLLVTRMQESRASLCLKSTQCIEKINELGLAQQSLYADFIKKFKSSREMLFRRTAEHLHFEMRI